MEDKKQNSIDELNKRIDKLGKPIVVATSVDFISILLQGKSPQYLKRFSAWCRNTLDSPYHKDMTEALLSMYAISLLTSDSKFTDDFVKGQADNLLFVGEEMERLSVQEFNKE